MEKNIRQARYSVQKVYDGDHFYFERNAEDITAIIGKTAKKIIEKI